MSSADLTYICNAYLVPAKVGGRVRYTGGRDGPRCGTVIGARNGKLRIETDDGDVGYYHPTWEIEYLRS